MAMEYYSFEKVLKELIIDEDELKRLVSEGEIRAFRDEDKMKFKKTDIDGLKKGRMTEPTIILPSGEGSASDDEVLLVEEDTSETLLDIDDIGGGSSSTSVPTVDFGSSSDDSAAETLTEELVFDDKSIGFAESSSSGTQMTEGLESQDTFIDEDSGMTTEPLELLESSDEVASVPQQRGSSGGPSAAPRMAPRPMVAAPKQSHPIMSAVLVFTALVSIYSGFLVYGLILDSDNDVTGGWTDFVVQYALPEFAAKNPAQPNPNEKIEHVKWRKSRRAAKAK